MKKNVVIIGGTSGIGEETSNLLMENGFKTIVGARINNNTNANYQKIDVTNEKSIKKFFNKIQNIDGLVYSVGIPIPKTNIKHFSKINWDKIVNVNVTGALLTLKYSYEKLKRSKGKVVIVNSIAARSSSVFSGLEYTMTKSALSGMVRHLSIDFAKDGILINSVFPSMTSTKMLQENVKKEEIKKITKKIPLHKLASTKDTANAIKFLISDENNYITGSGIDINGGQFLSS